MAKDYEKVIDYDDRQIELEELIAKKKQSENTEAAKVARQLRDLAETSVFYGL